MTDTVDPRLTGVWRRELITTPAGHRDETTRVFWVQTRSWYADIRVPVARPTRPGGAGFTDYGPDDLIELATMQGFAGQLSADPQICRWRRDLDFQPPSGSADEGTWDLDGDVMVERGLDGGYEEIWRLEPASRGPLLAFGLASDAAKSGLRGLLVVAGDHFLAIRERPQPSPAGRTLKEVVAAAVAAGELGQARAALAMPIAYGRIAGGAVPWEVQLSTWPWLEGAGFWPGDAAFDPVARALRCAGSDQAWSLLDSSAETGRIGRHLGLPVAAAPAEIERGGRPVAEPPLPRR